MHIQIPPGHAVHVKDALIAGTELIEYDGEPHGLFATAPDRLSGDLLDFLGGR